MSARAQFACSLFVCLAAAVCVSAQTWSALSTNQSIVAQMARAQAENRSHFRPYTVTREYKLFRGNNRDEAKTLVIAEITAVRADSKQYAIDNPGESGFGEKIVRKMLDSEVAFAKDSGSTAITRDNYDFLFVREDEFSGKRCMCWSCFQSRNPKTCCAGPFGWMPVPTFLTVSRASLQRVRLGGLGMCALFSCMVLLAQCGCRRLRKLKPTFESSVCPPWFHET